MHSKRYLNEISNGVVIDIGSGRSDHGRWLGKNNIFYRLDYPTTNERYGNTPDIYGDACSLPLKAASADTIISFEVLEHVSDSVAALDEIQRVLRPGGRLYLSVPFIYPLHDQPFDYRRFTIHGLRQSLSARNMHVEREVRHGNSFLVALQIFNLALLEIIYKLSREHGAAASVFALFSYPLMLGTNLLALPFLQVKSLDASCFGYFIVAKHG